MSSHSRPEGAAPESAAPQLQPRLAVGRAGDRWEQAAEQAAARVLASAPPAAPPGDAPLVQRMPSGAAWGSPAPDAARAALGGASQPLDSRTRADFEPRFGHDFSRVRLHTGPQAAAGAEAVRARAYTVGEQIVFGAGEYAPGSGAGRALLAHELAHVVQQGAGGRVIQRAPAKPTEIKRVEIFLDSKKVIVFTTNNAYEYALSEAVKLAKGESFQGSHTSGQRTDMKVDGKGFTVSWKRDGPAPAWEDFPTSTFTVTSHGSSKAADGGSGGSGSAGKSGSGSGAKGTGSGGGGSATDATGGVKKDSPGAGGGSGGGAQGKKGTASAGGASAQEKLDKFLKAAAARGKGEETKLSDADKEKLKALLEGLSEEEIAAFFSVTSELDRDCTEAGKCPNRTLAEMLDFYKNLSPPDREALSVNQMLRQAPNAPRGELPKEVLLAIKTDAATSAKVTQAGSDINKNLALIQAKISDPTLKRDFEPLDPTTLSEFNTVLMLQGMLAGASERSPAIHDLAYDLSRNLSKVRDFIIEELLWLAAEIAATQLAAILAAPFTAGGSAVAGAAAAAVLIVRLNKLRKLLQKLQKLYEVVQRVEAIIATVQKVKAIADNVALFKQYEEKFAKVVELRELLNSPDSDTAVAEKLEEAEAELLKLLQGELMEKLDPILDQLYLPPDATQDELIEILFDIPRGIDALKDMLAYRGKAAGGSADDTAVLAIKGFRAGYLLAPFVGYMTGIVNDALGSIIQETDLADRLIGIGLGGGGGKPKVSIPTGSTKKRFSGLSSRKARNKAQKKAQKGKGPDADATKKPDTTPDAPKKPSDTPDAPKKPADTTPDVPKKPTDTPTPDAPKKPGDTPDPNAPTTKKPGDSPDPDASTTKKEGDDKPPGTPPPGGGDGGSGDWAALKAELVVLAKEAETANGITKVDLQAKVKAIVGKARYKKFAPRAAVSERVRGDKPGYFQLVVEDTTIPRAPVNKWKKPKVRTKANKHLSDIEILYIRPEQTRYADLRTAITSSFAPAAFPEKKRTEPVIRARLTDLEDKYLFKGKSLTYMEPINAADGTLVAYEVGVQRNGAKSKLAKIDLPGNYWGSKNNPIDINWPKRAITRYEPLYIGPYLQPAPFPIPQADLKAIRNAAATKKQEFADKLKTQTVNTTVQSNIDNWAAAGATIKVYNPTDAPTRLPPPSRTSLGVLTKWQTIKDKFPPFQLKWPGDDSPGGKKINEALWPFGYFATTEKADGDHVWEWQVGGDDEIGNLWPLDKVENNAAGPILAKMRFAKPDGSGTVKMIDLKKLSQTKALYFKIRAFTK